MYWSAGEKPLSNSQLAKLLALYEQNYVLIRLLVPRLQEMRPGVYWSRLGHCLDLRLQVLEISPYTTTVNLSYVFDGSTRGHAAPDLQIRVYHDARSTEALSGLVHGHRLTTRTVRTLEGSWQLNRFLYKWLRYCRHRGHHFDIDTNTLAERAEQPAQKVLK